MCCNFAKVICDLNSVRTVCTLPYVYDLFYMYMIYLEHLYKKRFDRSDMSLSDKLTKKLIIKKQRDACHVLEMSTV